VSVRDEVNREHFVLIRSIELGLHLRLIVVLGVRPILIYLVDAPLILSPIGILIELTLLD
jgi:hypothetical protein